MLKRAAFRTKGNNIQGMGDVMGSIALALEFRKRGYKAVFVAEDDAEAKEALSEAGFPLYIASRREEDAWRGIGAFTLVIVNQLTTEEKILSVIRKYAEKLVTIDDVGDASRRLADLRINPLYYDEGALADFSYIPLNGIYRKARTRVRRVRREVENILVALGGSDTYGFTPKVVSYLGDVDEGIRVDVLLGPAFRHRGELGEALKKSRRDFNVIGPRSPEEVCGLISGADIVICSGGNTMFEAVCLGRPSVVVCAEPFEVETAGRLMEAGIVVNAGFGGNLEREPFLRATCGLIGDFRRRLAMSRKGFNAVDGRGTERIFEKIVSLQSYKTLETRK